MMADVWLTSDFHLGHFNIIRYCNRPFADTKEMNAAILERVNASVKPDDVLYFLGGFCMGGPKAVAFYRDLFAFELFFSESRMAALGVPGAQVLLLFQRGATLEPAPMNTGRGAHRAISSGESTGRSAALRGPSRPAAAPYFRKLPAIQ